MIEIRTASGRLLDLEAPRVEDVVLGDIARGLSHCCRFVGQLPTFYSVAQHSVLVASLCDPEIRLAALLHDASEAYLGDLSRNLKHHPLLEGYRTLERRLQDVIYAAFDLAPHPQIKLADDLAASYERVVLREGRAFRAADVERLVSEGFVHDAPEDLALLVPRLPRCGLAHLPEPHGAVPLPRTWLQPFEPWSAPHAEAVFLAAFEVYSGNRGGEL